MAKKHEMPNTLANLKECVGEFLLLGDDGIVDAIIAAVVANKLGLDPVWLMIVAGSSSGKSELLAPLFGLKFITPISDLTVNTFSSGYKMGGGQQASLLLKIQNGILVFKDFTTILSKSIEARGVILGQLREIYDGKTDKHTGTGEVIAWKGKIGILAASTSMIYQTLEDSNSMGQRFIYYNIKQPDRLAAARKAQDNAARGLELRAKLADVYQKYILMVFANIDKGKVEYDPPKSLTEEMTRIADFATRARSPVHTDWKTGQIDDQPDLEQAGRVTKQLLAMASAFIAMNRSEPDLTGKKETDVITEHQRRVIYRCAFDSISGMRRACMRILARYRGGVNTTAAATSLGMSSDSIKKYLYQLNALGICTRKAESGNKGHKWTMTNDEHRRVVCLLEGIVPLDQEFVKSEEEDESEVSLDPDMAEQNRAELERFDALPDTPEDFK